jgi:hypothetical protein
MVLGVFSHSVKNVAMSISRHSLLVDLIIDYPVSIVVKNVRSLMGCTHETICVDLALWNPLDSDYRSPWDSGQRSNGLNPHLYARRDVGKLL